MKLESVHLGYLRVLGDKPAEPFRWLSLFTYKANSKYGSKTLYDDISRYFVSDLEENIGIIMMAEGIYIFSEVKPNIDDLVVKMTTNTNYEGTKEFDLNGWIAENLGEDPGPFVKKIADDLLARGK